MPDAVCLHLEAALLRYSASFRNRAREGPSGCKLLAVADLKTGEPFSISAGFRKSGDDSVGCIRDSAGRLKNRDAAHLLGSGRLSDCQVCVACLAYSSPQQKSNAGIGLKTGRAPALLEEHLTISLRWGCKFRGYHRCLGRLWGEGKSSSLWGSSSNCSWLRQKSTRDGLSLLLRASYRNNILGFAFSARALYRCTLAASCVNDCHRVRLAMLL